MTVRCLERSIQSSIWAVIRPSVRTMNRSRTHVAVLGVALAFAAACTTAPPQPDPAIATTLAPTGTLRIAVYPGSPTSIVRDATTGEERGVAVDLGRAMAEKLGVPSSLVEAHSNAEVLAALKEARADFAFTNATPVRARDMDFSPAVLFVEQGYLVPFSSMLDSADAVDRAGVRIGVTRGSTSERELPQLLKSATVVPVPSLQDAARMLREGALDALATNKAILHEVADGVPGSRILPGAYGREFLAIAVPKGRERALPWLRAFVSETKSSGTVTLAVQRAGVRGTRLAD
jgi:polar amino acid transport system substrate-binding protein